MKKKNSKTKLDILIESNDEIVKAINKLIASEVVLVTTLHQILMAELEE